MIQNQFDLHSIWPDFCHCKVLQLFDSRCTCHLGKFYLEPQIESDISTTEHDPFLVLSRCWYDKKRAVQVVFLTTFPEVAPIYTWMLIMVRCMTHRHITLVFQFLVDSSTSHTRLLNVFDFSFSSRGIETSLSTYYIVFNG